MNFDLTDGQRMLKDSVDRLLAERYQLDHRLAGQREPAGYSAEIWNAFADMGLTMLPFPEEAGGLGLGSIEMMLVGEAFGRALVIEPYLSSIVLAGTAIASGAEDPAAMLAGIMSGQQVAAMALGAQVTEEGGVLSGEARVVLGGDSASLFIVPLGDAAVCIPADVPGLQVRPYRLHGGGGAADLVIDRIDVASLVRLGEGCVTRATEAGLAFIAAEASGAMQAALALTVDYLQTRQQFDRAIGSYQALQHRAAEMVVEVEQAQSAAIYAALLMQEPDDRERTRGLAAVKAVTGKAGRFIAQSAVQLHGGIGVSEEHIVSHYFRRLTAIGMVLGDTHSHVRRLAGLGGFTSPGEIS